MQITEEILMDYVMGELSPQEKLEVEEALIVSEELRKQLEEIQELSLGLKSLPLEKPSENLRLSIEGLIAEERQPVSSSTRISYLSLGIAASILILIGVWLGVQWQSSKMDTRMQTMEMVQMMQGDRSSIKIKAVSMAMELPEVNGELLEQLSELLVEDESVGVRLAALDGLYELQEREALELTLMDALRKEQKPIVQIALIQALVELQTEEAIPLFQDLIEADSTFQQVKDEAHIGTFKLI
ncbi:MAG: HEAT repeat domain-containing protein [Bacteroidota bacterium]